jgi:hypothetical protein
MNLRWGSFLAHSWTKRASAIRKGPAITAAGGALISAPSRMGRPLVKNNERLMAYAATAAAAIRLLSARTHRRKRTVYPPHPMERAFGTHVWLALYEVLYLNPAPAPRVVVTEVVPSGEILTSTPRAMPSPAATLRS